MKRPAVFFDRDNTLIVNDGYLGDAARVVIVDGAADAIARCRSLGYAVVVISNQSGVARGLFDEEAVHAVNHRMEQLLKASNSHAIIDRHEFCPYHPDGTVPQYRRESELRKPRPGMILQAARSLALDLPRSWLVGDAPRDIEAGRAVGCRTILFFDPNMPASSAASAIDEARADFTAGSLREAIDFVEQHPRIAGDDAEAMANTPAAVAETPPALHLAGTPAAEPHHERTLAERLAPDAPPSSPMHIVGTSAGDVGMTHHDAPLAEDRAASEAAAPPAMHIAQESAEQAATHKSGIFKQGFPFDPRDTAPPAETTPPAAPRPSQLAIDPVPLPRPLDSIDTQKIERLLEQLITEFKRQHEQPPSDFSVPKLLAGIAQMVAIAAGIFAYFEHAEPGNIGIQLLLAAVLLQGLTMSLLLMGRQR